MYMLKLIERATKQKITALTMPTPGEVANRRVAQFTQQIVDIIKTEKLDFFFDVVRRMEGEQDIAAREIAAALAWLATRERPLQMPGANDHAPRDVAAAPAAVSPAPTFVRDTERKPARASTKPPESHPDAEPRRERPVKEGRSDTPVKQRSFADGATMQRYRIEIGRNQGVLPKEIVGAIANEAGIAGKDIGQINLFEDYSSVELPANLSDDLMDILRRIRVRQFALKTRVMEPGEFVDTRPPRRAPPAGDRKKPDWKKPAGAKPEWKKREK
jgi:ATP-dependent RNA helicase DeaD